MCEWDDEILQSRHLQVPASSENFELGDADGKNAARFLHGKFCFYNKVKLVKIQAPARMARKELR